MQKIACFLFNLLPLAVIAQDKIELSNTAAGSDKKNQQVYNNDGHTLELVFTIAANRQHIFRNMAGKLATSAGKLDFVFSGETMMLHKNKLRFTSQSGKVYIFLNDALRTVINDEQQVYAVCTPGYNCSLTDIETNSDIAMQAESITVGYKPYDPVSSSTVIITETEKDPKTISIFPNPVHNNLNIRTGSKEESSIMLLNAEGKQLITKTISGATTLDLKELPGGLYFLRVDTDKNAPIIRSFIKQ